MGAAGSIDAPSGRRRIGSAVAVAALHALLGYAFLVGLGMRLPVKAEASLKIFDVLPAPPPPPRLERRPARAKAPRRQGAASPRNLRFKATEVVAPEVPLPPPPPPLIVAPVADLGADPSTGASTVRGPGTGSGGLGRGTGSGNWGNGDGGGGGGRPLRWRSGRLRSSDLPRAIRESDASGTVYLRFTVGVTGRVTDCTVTRSSGNAALDDITCRLIIERLRYTPTTDETGRPIPDTVTGEQDWHLYRDDQAEGPANRQ